MKSVLREKRAVLGLTQQNVADKAKIILQQYQKFESGERSIMTCSFQIACRVIEALEMDISKFYHGEYQLSDCTKTDQPPQYFNECFWGDEMNPKYVINLTTQERERLEEIVGTLEASAATITHAQVLLASDIHVSPKLSVREISERFDTNHQTVYQIRSDYVEFGLERAIYRKARTVIPETKKLNPKVIEQIKELALSAPPEGKKTWSIRSLCKACTEKRIVNHIANASMLTILRQLNITLGTEKEN